MDFFLNKYHCNGCSFKTNDLAKINNKYCDNCNELKEMENIRHKQAISNNFKEILEILKNEENKDILIAWMLSNSLRFGCSTISIELNDIVKKIKEGI